MHGACGVVVGVKKEGVLRDLRAVPRDPDFHDERLEKPSRVREMPFRWAHVRHGLHHAIFRLQSATKANAEIAHRPKALE